MADPDTTATRVSLPEPLNHSLDGKVSSAPCGSASECVRETIGGQSHEGERDAPGAKLREGLSSGVGISFTGEYIPRKKRALVARLKQQRPD